MNASRPRAAASAPPAVLEERLDRVVLAALKPVSLGLAILYAAYAVSHLRLLPPPAGPMMAAVAGGTALVLALVRVRLSRRGLPPRRAHLVASGIACLALANVWVHLYVADDHKQTINFILILLAAGGFLLSARWFAGLMLFALAGFAGVASTSLPREHWVSDGFAILAASLLALLLFTVRRRTQVRLETSLAQNAADREHLRASAADLEQRNALLNAIRRAQAGFIADAEPRALFESLLADILHLTGSAYGFVAEVLHRDGVPYMKTHAITNIAWDAESLEFYQRGVADGLEFTNLETLFGAVLTTREAVLSNQPASDPRRGGLPPGHPALDAFLGAPVRAGGEMVGVLGLANRLGGYDEAMLESLQPILSTCGSILQAMRSEGRRATAEAQTRLIVGAALDAVVSADAEGRIVEWNPQAERTFGWTRQEALGRTLQSTIIPERFREAHLRGWRHYLATREGPVLQRRIEIDAIDRSGREFPVELAISPIWKGEQVTFCAFIRDIRDRRDAEAQILKARDAAEAASRAKSDFLATMSHEIRTPMNGVIGMTGLLLTTQLDEEQRDYAETVRKSAESLLHIINDILDYSKVEAGKLELEDVPFEPRELVAEIVDLLEESATRKGLRLGSTVEEAVPQHLRGDPGRLRQILTNLAGNAVKFTRSGWVEIRVGVVKRSGAPDQIRFEVADTGAGIPPEVCQRLFQPFSQADSSTTRRFGGTGLGLAISKRLVDLMSGTIGVDSEVGGGSRFWFLLPLPAVETSDVARATVTLTGRRGLLIGTGSDHAQLVRQFESWGTRCDAATAAREGLAALRRAAEAGSPYDFAVIDNEAGEIDGPGLAREVRADHAIGNTALLVLERESAPSAGPPASPSAIDATMRKPVRQSRLYDCLSAIVAAAQPAAVPEPQADSPGVPLAATKGLILLAEDNLVNQRVALFVLRRLGYAAEVVDNGLAAVEAACHRPYDLVLMDCHMPEMDGYQATAEIRRRLGTRHLPIVAMTAHAMSGDRQKCLDAGMDDYLSKPVREQELAAVLRERIGPRNRPVAQPDTAASDQGGTRP